MTKREVRRNCHGLYIVSLRKSCTQLFCAAKRNPWFAKNTHATDFFVFYRMNLFNLLAQNSNDDSYIFLCYMPEVPNVGLICWLEIVMIIHISFCTTCQKFRMLVS